MRLYLTLGVSYVGSTLSSKVKDLTNMIGDAMNHRGFSIVHVQSPCTTYNNTYEQLKGNVKKGIAPIAWDIPEDHDETELSAAYSVVETGGVPLGILYKNDRPSLDQRLTSKSEKMKARDLNKLLGSYSI